MSFIGSLIIAAAVTGLMIRHDVRSGCFPTTRKAEPSYSRRSALSIRAEHESEVSALEAEAFAAAAAKHVRG